MSSTDDKPDSSTLGLGVVEESGEGETSVTECLVSNMNDDSGPVDGGVEAELEKTPGPDESTVDRPAASEQQDDAAVTSATANAAVQAGATIRFSTSSTAAAGQEATEPSTLSSTSSDTTVIGPSLTPIRPTRFFSPYIEDQVMTSSGPDIFAKNIKNAIESRRHEEGGMKTENETADEEEDEEKAQKDESTPEATPSNVIVVDGTPPVEDIRQSDQPTGVETQTEPTVDVTRDETTLAEAKDWHDSIIGRISRLRGLSTWLGERNKRMDGMVEILVRSLEHMGVGAVTDHVGNLIPLQNFRLNSAIKLSPADNTWVTRDDDLLSNDINAWLPNCSPDDHNTSLTMEQMRKYESQVDALRTENESLQRSLQAALDNQGTLGSHAGQWQACIESAGQQLCQVTKDVHDSKSRERHLRHLLGEERRIKDSLLQRNRAMKAETHEHTTQNVTAWQQDNRDVVGQPQLTNTTAIVNNNPGFVNQGMAFADRQPASSSPIFSHSAAVSAPPVTATTAHQHVSPPAAHTVEETPWQRRRVSSFPQRDARSSGLNSSAPPFRPTFTPSHRPHYRSYAASSDSNTRPESLHQYVRHSAGYRRKQHSSNASFNRVLDGFFDNLNRIEDALRQQGINIPGPSSVPTPTAQQPSLQVPFTQQQQQPTGQTIYYSPPPPQPAVCTDAQSASANQVQSLQPVVHQVQTAQPLVQVLQPQVQFAQVEGQAY